MPALFATALIIASAGNLVAIVALVVFLRRLMGMEPIRHPSLGNVIPLRHRGNHPA